MCYFFCVYLDLLLTIGKNNVFELRVLQQSVRNQQSEW